MVRLVEILKFVLLAVGFVIQVAFSAAGIGILFVEYFTDKTVLFPFFGMVLLLAAAVVHIAMGLLSDKGSVPEEEEGQELDLRLPVAVTRIEGMIETILARHAQLAERFFWGWANGFRWMWASFLFIVGGLLISLLVPALDLIGWNLFGLGAALILIYFFGAANSLVYRLSGRSQQE